ncbi:MAG: pyridoxamine 5'-phosphate oxidase family protein [Myxococcota bacterium]
MTDEEIRAYLQEGHTLTLVTNGPRGFPHAVAMFYALDLTDDEIVIKFATYASSQKVKNAQKDPRCTLLIETGHVYSELRGLMMEGELEILTDLDETVRTMVEANARTGSPLPDVDLIPEDVKMKMAGKRVLMKIRPSRFVSWDHGKLPGSKTPDAMKSALG